MNNLMRVTIIVLVFLIVVSLFGIGLNLMGQDDYFNYTNEQANLTNLSVSSLDSFLYQDLGDQDLGDNEDIEPIITTSNISYKDEALVNIQQKVLDKSVSKFNNMLVISKSLYPIIYEAPSSLTNILEFEFQIEDLDTGKNISLKGKTKIPKHYTGEFDFNSSLKEMVWFKDLKEQPKIDWEYSTGYRTERVNYTDEFSDSKGDVNMNIVFVNEKVYTNYSSLKTVEDIDGIKTSYFSREAYLDPDVTECGVINISGNYVLTNSTIVNYPVTCINISASDVTFDCQGYTIDGDRTPTVSSNAIYLVGNSSNYLNNIMVKNCMVNDFTRAVYLRYVNNSFFINTTLNGTVVNPIDLDYVYNSLFANSTISNAYGRNDNYGVKYYHGRNNSFDNVNFINNYEGIRFVYYNLNITNSHFINNTIGINIIHESADNGLFYNNYFANNSADINAVAGANNFFNTTLNCTGPKNIIGGDCIGGNYYANYSGTGYSETCADVNSNGICDVPVNLSNNNGTACPGCSGYNIDSYPLCNIGNLDIIYPLFSNYWDNNGSLNSSGLGLFNVTIANTNGTVWLEINNTNITALNLTGNVFNISYDFTLNKTYEYKWYAYGNGTSHNLNNSGVRYYTVNETYPDNEYPLFYGYSDNNATLVGSGLATFNVSINNTNGTVILQVNSTTNYTAFNSTGNMFNVSVTLQNGTYTYRWHTYGNGTLSLYNKSNDRYYTINDSDVTPPVCTLISRTPTNIVDNSSGVLNVIINCTDLSGINVTQITTDHYPFFITRTVDAFILAEGIPNYWSNRYPNNSISVEGTLTPPYKIWRALGRNRGFWYENLTNSSNVNQNISDCQGLTPCYRPLNDTYSYAIEDGNYGHFVVTNTSTNAIINYTYPEVGVAAFRQSVYYSYEAMVKESKKNKTIENNNYVLMKRFDAEAYRGTQNYTMNSFRNFGVVGSPSKTLRAFYCNSSYNPAGTTTVLSSPNCALINSLTATEINNRIYSDRNSSYSKGTYGITNGKFGGIVATAEFYIEYESPQTSAAAYYQIRYVNGSTLPGVPNFNDSKVAWTTTNGGVTWTQAAWTPDVFTTYTRDANDQFQFGLYICDKVGNCYKNFTMIQDDITPTNHPISYPLVLEYNSSAYQMDLNMNETHKGTMNIKIGVSKDPDSVGNVTHNLTLRNLDGTWNYTINTSFKSPTDSDIWVDFNTASVPDGLYRMMIEATSGDNVLDIKNRTTDRNFTIDNTPPYFTTIPASTVINYTQGFGVLFVATDSNSFGSYKINSTSFFVINQSGYLQNSTPNIAVGLYYINVSINDTVGNSNSTTYLVNVSKATLTLTFTANGGTSNLSLSYPQQVNITATNNSGTLSLEKDGEDYLTSNGLNVTFGVGSYIFKANITGNTNYSDIINRYFNITITQGTPPLTITILPSSTVENETETTATGIGCPVELTCNFSRENVSVANPDIQTLNVGTYVYTFNTTGNTNYTLFSFSKLLTIVNKSSSGTTTISANRICRYKKLGYYNLKLPWLRETNCL